MRQLLIIVWTVLLCSGMVATGQNNLPEYTETLTNSNFLLNNQNIAGWHYDDIGIRDSLGNPLGWSLSKSTISPVELYGCKYIGDATSTQYFIPTLNDINVLLHNTKYKCEPILERFKGDDYYSGLPYWLQGTWTYKSISISHQGTPVTYSEAFVIKDNFATLLLPAYVPLGRVSYSDGIVCIDSKRYRVITDSSSRSRILVSEGGDEFHNTGGMTEKCVGYNISLIGRNNSQAKFQVHSTPMYIMTATPGGNNTFWALRLSSDRSPELEKVADTTKLSIMMVRRDYAGGEMWRQRLYQIAGQVASAFFNDAMGSYPVNRPIHEDIAIDREPLRKRFEEFERRYYDIPNSHENSSDLSYFTLPTEEIWISPADYRMLRVYGHEVLDSLIICHDALRHQAYQKTCMAKQFAEFKALQSMLDEINNTRGQLFDYSVWVARSGEIRVRVLTSKYTRKLFSLFQKFLKNYAEELYSVGYNGDGRSFRSGQESQDLTFSLTDRYYTQAPEGSNSAVSLRAPIYRVNPVQPSYGGYIEHRKRTDFKVGTYGKIFDEGFYAHLFMDYMQRIRESAENDIQTFVKELAPDVTDLNFRPILPLKNSLSYGNLRVSDYSFSLDDRYEVIPFLQTDLENGMPIYEVTFSVGNVESIDKPKGRKVNIIDVDRMPPYGGLK